MRTTPGLCKEKMNANLTRMTAHMHFKKEKEKREKMNYFVNGNTIAFRFSSTMWSARAYSFKNTIWSTSVRADRFTYIKATN